MIATSINTLLKDVPREKASKESYNYSIGHARQQPIHTLLTSGVYPSYHYMNTMQGHLWRARRMIL